MKAVLEGTAENLVSGDEGLLQIKVYEGTQIVSPADFFAILQSS